MSEHKKILIWGTGRLSGMVLEKVIDIDDVVAFIDNDERKKSFLGKSVAPRVQ